MLPLPQGKIDKKSVRIMTEDGTSVIDIDRISRKGNKLFMHGLLMGQFDTAVYITPDDVFKIIPMMLKPQPLVFILLSPFFWAWNRISRKETEDDDD